MKIDVNLAKLVRLNGQFNERSRYVSSISEEFRDMRFQLQQLEFDWASRVGRTEDDGTAITDPLSTLNWPAELKQHAGIGSRQPYELVACRARVEELRRNLDVAMQRAHAYSTWFGRTKRFAQDQGVDL